MRAEQTLDTVATAALERGETITIEYDSGWTHRLRLGTMQPPAAVVTETDVWRELIRLPLDVFAQMTVKRAEAMVRMEARRHGRWTARVAAE